MTSRRQKQQEQSDKSTTSNHDQDCVLLLEHFPVYTLGRGSDEAHLTFVGSNGTPALNEEVRRKLSRSVRGPGTARLALDAEGKKLIDDSCQESLVVGLTDDAVQELLPVAEALAHGTSPVLAPNGVPIYRAERGGEVTFHGPSQLVVYPMLDLQQEPFRSDLHWYLRQIEEVVIQTLRHYGIEGSRDADNTGTSLTADSVPYVSCSKWVVYARQCLMPTVVCCW